MKRLLCLLVLFALPLTAQAQIFLSAHGGYATLSSTEDTANWWETGFSLGARFSYPINDLLAFFVDGSYSNIAFDDNAFAEEWAATFPGDPNLVEIGGTSTTTRTVMIGLRVAAPTPYVRPYMLGGVGYFSYSRPQVIFRSQGGSAGFFTGASEDGFGFQVGGGLEVPISSRFGVFAEGRYVIGSIEEEFPDAENELVMKEVGIHVLSIEAGIRFSLSRL